MSGNVIELRAGVGEHERPGEPSDDFHRLVRVAGRSRGYTEAFIAEQTDRLYALLRTLHGYREPTFVPVTIRGLDELDDELRASLLEDVEHVVAAQRALFNRISTRAIADALEIAFPIGDGGETAS